MLPLGCSECRTPFFLSQDSGFRGAAGSYGLCAFELKAFAHVPQTSCMCDSMPGRATRGFAPRVRSPGAALRSASRQVGWVANAWRGSCGAGLDVWLGRLFDMLLLRGASSPSASWPSHCGMHCRIRTACQIACRKSL